MNKRSAKIPVFLPTPLFFATLLTALLLAAPLAGAAQPAPRFNVRDYGALADGKTDDGPAIARALAAARNAAPGAVVFIPGGTYSLQTPAGGAMITIQDATSLTLEGEAGTTLISNQPAKHMIQVVNSKNITVRRLTLDRHPLVFTQGVIDKIDAAARTAEVIIDAGYDEPDSQYLARLKTFHVFTDPAADTWDHSRWSPVIQQRERLAPLKWRFTLSASPLPAYPGKRFLIWDNVYKGWGVQASKSTDVTVEDINYYGGGADAGIGVWGCSGTITYRRFKVSVPPGSNRLIAAAGGGQEFQNRGTFVMDGCDISRVDDDGMNQGTTYARVLRQPDRRTIEVEGRGIPFQPGDTIALWDWGLKKERGQARLVSFSLPASGAARLTLDRDVTVEHPVGSPGLPQRSEWKGGGRFEEFDGIDRIADFEAAGKAVVRNCRFQNMRARNILIKASDSLIENNTFYNTHMTAILVGPEFYWGEGPAVRNLVIRNNHFINIDGSSINLGCHKSENSFDNHNIVIEGNTFEGYGRLGGTEISGRQGTAVLVRNADGVVIRNNKFGPPSASAPAANKPLMVEASKNVKLEGNELDGKELK